MAPGPVVAALALAAAAAAAAAAASSSRLALAAAASWSALVCAGASSSSPVPLLPGVPSNFVAPLGAALFIPLYFISPISFKASSVIILIISSSVSMLYLFNFMYTSISLPFCHPLSAPPSWVGASQWMDSLLT